MLLSLFPEEREGTFEFAKRKARLAVFSSSHVKPGSRSSRVPYELAAQARLGVVYEQRDTNPDPQLSALQGEEERTERRRIQ